MVAKIPAPKTKSLREKVGKLRSKKQKKTQGGPPLKTIQQDQRQDTGLRQSQNDLMAFKNYK